MKRDYQHHPAQQDNFSSGASGSGSGSSNKNDNNSSVYPAPPATPANTGKAKMWEESEQGDDELLAVLGYKVRSLDMADVAQKLEHLEEVMGQVQEDGLTHLGSDTVHYNPSDLSSWLESMITELDSTHPIIDDSFLSQTNPNPTPGVFQNDNLESIPGTAVYPPNKKLKPSHDVPTSNQFYGVNNNIPQAAAESTRQIILVDSQENGIRLVHTLMACAEAVQQENLKLAEALVKQIGFLAVSQAGAMRKVATYFAEALARRIYKLYPPVPQDTTFSDVLQMHFYETCPYLKFAHFTANQAILEAFSDQKRVHVIDFSMKQGMQWPALMKAFALQPGGPPSFRLTGIGPPAQDGSDHLQEVGWKLAQLADTFHIEFEYRGFVANSLADLDASMLNLREGEVVAVNSVFEMHSLLARPGGVEKVLSAVKAMNPVIATVVEQEANHNGPVFLDRFTEALHYYSTLFDSLESSAGGEVVAAASNQDRIMSEVYLGKQICNVVACEGGDRVERHETLVQWRNRFDSAGFVPVHLGSNAFKQASMLLAFFAGGEGYRVEERDGCLMLGWHTRPLITTSAWKLRRSVD